MKSDETHTAKDASAATSKQTSVLHLRQLITVFALQMRLYSKSVSTYIYIILALMVPVLVYAGLLNRVSDISGFDLNAAYALILLPLMIVAIPARFSAKILSSEFKNRTAFINFPLPMSRITFYMGKFLAAATMSIAVMLLAIGGAVVSCNAKFGIVYPNDIASMLIVCIAGMMALLAMTYFFGTILKRGAGALSMVLTLATPYLFLAVFGFDSGVWSAIGITPFFSSYQSLWFIDNGFLTDIFESIFINSYSAYQFAAVSAAWCAGFLALGALVTKNKEV
jgi:ABC-type transport system involved in multi-copper enzyme maturation permease subunit